MRYSTEKNDRTSISNSFKIDNTIENDPTYIADKFSEFFSEIGPKYASNISLSSTNYQTYILTCKKATSLYFAGRLVGFVVRGESPGCRLISTASMLEWLRNLLPHHSQRSSTERWSRNTMRVVTARVFYVLSGFLTSPFILNNSVETAAPFNVVIHPRCSEPRN